MADADHVHGQAYWWSPRFTFGLFHIDSSLASRYMPGRTAQAENVQADTCVDASMLLHVPA